ncbi:hypothetical protein HaLaN_03602, partial [Haematococcus lacustris]
MILAISGMSKEDAMAEYIK